MSDEILTRNETLKALGNISLSTLHRLIDRGEITPIEDTPAVLRRRALLFRRSDVEALLKKERKAKTERKVA